MITSVEHCRTGALHLIAQCCHLLDLFESLLSHVQQKAADVSSCVMEANKSQKFRETKKESFKLLKVKKNTTMYSNLLNKSFIFI